MTFTRSDVEKVMELAQKAGDHELLSRFLPKKPLVAVKRDLVRSIRNEEVNEGLWRSYVEATKSKLGNK